VAIIDNTIVFESSESVVSSTVATSYSDTPTGCAIVEKAFAEECSAGYYGVENLVIDSSDEESVTFRVKHGFGKPLSPVEVWYKNAAEDNDFCWFDANVSPGQFFEPSFTAKCINKWATVTVAGGDENSGFRQFVEKQEPQCQGSIDLPDFNPRKRCV
jgi:hypothetical protein